MAILLCKKLDQLKESIRDLEYSLTIQYRRLNPYTIKTIKYGQIKQFEVCSKELWDTLYEYVEIETGVKCKTITKVLDEYSKHYLCDTHTLKYLKKIYHYPHLPGKTKSEKEFEECHKYVLENGKLFSHIYCNISLLLD